ncbi:type I restriction enzyme, S subunit [Streptosporangium subroseum]|uniref:Type I restriction enzyme, S subunit n=1 Tax=Streptosporangium subroseum TaxID=106412 RepID=A0A239JKI4_9ACTN|nr:restriction endonuclease subunit S [Streptosporangium subroseum]SNT06391.1 type I restriction enzyme, S subunit [Streptosporangium subroseum]
MSVKQTTLGSVLKLERIPLEIDLESEYVQIGIRSFGKGIFHRLPVKGEDLSRLRYFKLRPNRLIVSNIMAWEGAIAVSGDAEKDCVGSSRFLSYAPAGEIDLSYINYFFQSEAGRTLIKGTSTGTVLRNQTLSIKNFESMRIPLPNLDEQRRVAGRLDAVFSRIDDFRQNRSRSTIAREQLFGSYLRDSPNWAPLGDALISEIDGVDVSPDETYRIAGVFGRGRGIFGRGPILGNETSYKKLHRIHAGSLVMSRLKAFEGAIGVVPDEFDGWFLSPEFPTFAVREDRAIMNYIKHLCSWPDFWGMLQGESKGLGARRERVSANRLLSIRVPLPNLDEQRIIAIKFDRLARIEKIGRHQEEILKALKASSLNAAFNNQI